MAAIAGPSLLGTPPRGDRTPPRVGAQAPDFVLADLISGEEVRLSSLKGKPVWLNFWASWCDGCREEMPQIRSAHQRYAGEGLAILGINVQEPRDKALAFVRENGLDWTFLLDTDGRVTDLYWVPGVPHQVFIGRDGTIAAVHAGVISQENLDAYLPLILK